MKKWMKRIGIGSLIAVGVILLATAAYLVYLLVTVVIPMIPTLLYSFLKVL